MNVFRNGVARICASQRRGLFLVTCACLLLRSGIAVAGPRSVTGYLTIDVHTGTTPEENHTQVERAVATIDAYVMPNLQLYLDAGWHHKKAIADELYAALGQGVTRVRLGRFYVPFGIHAYPELYQTGFVLAPLVKVRSYDGFTLYRPEQGLSVESGTPRLRLEAAVMGGDGSQAAVGLDRLEDVSLRLQTERGSWILGLNGLAGTSRSPLESGVIVQRAVRLLGLDWRHSRRSWIVRGEYLVGKIFGSSVAGGYVDVLYHPETLPAWTFVFRAESIHLGDEAHRFTLGARYVPAPGWIVQLNWGEGSPSRTTRLLLLNVVRTIGL